MPTRTEEQLHEILHVLQKLVGEDVLEERRPFSEEALEKIAKAFRELQIKRGEWVAEDDLNKFIKHLPWHKPGKYLREDLEFQRCFKRGHTWYFYRLDVLHLAEELKKRNVQLKQYVELKEDQVKFSVFIKSVVGGTLASYKGKRYALPVGLKDVYATPAKPPDPERVKEEIELLKKEFFENNYKDYVDIQHANHALLKFIYHYERYLQPGLKRRLTKWCEEFNSANTLLTELTGKKQKFIPVTQKDQIEL
jgi:hypothetical protein